MTKKIIDFKEIKILFEDSEWDVGYLPPEYLKICFYSPLKKVYHRHGYDYTCNTNQKVFPNTLVIVKKSDITVDYDLYRIAPEILERNGYVKNIDWIPIYTNFKEAVILSGLGCRAKNSLVYTNKFGFDSKICCIGFIGEIVNIPDSKINFGYLPQCADCSDCRNACPVNAIHNTKKPYWLDSEKCDSFLINSYHDTIPSVKKFWHKYTYPEIPLDEILSSSKYENITDLKWDRNGYMIDKNGAVIKDGQWIKFPICRECQVQPKCSKWNGKYPYTL